MAGQRTVDLVVFDLDGTLIDSRRDLSDSVNALLADLGRAPLSETVVGAMVGEGARLLVNRALEARGLASDRPGALERFLELYRERLLVHTRAYDGVPEMLDALHARSIMAVLTNKPRNATGRILDGLGLSHHFIEMVGGDGPFPRKPDPASLRHLIEIADATPETTIMVGDSPIDLQTARRGATRVALARYGFGFRFTPEELAGVAVIDEPRDLLSLVGSGPKIGPSSR
jgi:phosphoglycolate phosphatase